MNTSAESSVARSLEAEHRILPWLPFLLEDLWALGSSPEMVVSLLKPLGLSGDSTTLADLGCGKGAVSIAVSKALGFSVTGIDACGAFLESARRKAIEHNVETRCNFIEADIRDYVRRNVMFDVAVYASLGDVLGDYNDIVKNIRRIVRPGGFIIIDDCFLKTPERLNRPGYEHCRPRDEVVQLLISSGDEIVQEILLPDEENKAINDGYLKAIQSRAEVLLREHPELTEAVHTYIDNQAEECVVIEKYLTGVIWMIRRSAE